MILGNLVRALGWAALWVLLFWVSRDNHPTVMLNAAATTLMVLASSGAIAFIRQISKRNSAIVKVCGAALCIVGAGVVAALAIRGIYDIEIGPDPRRFGLVANIGMDTAVVAVLVVLGSALDWGLRRLGVTGRS